MIHQLAEPSARCGNQTGQKPNQLLLRAKPPGLRHEQLHLPPIVPSTRQTPRSCPFLRHCFQCTVQMQMPQTVHKATDQMEKPMSDDPSVSWLQPVSFELRQVSSGLRRVSSV